MKNAITVDYGSVPYGEGLVLQEKLVSLRQQNLIDDLLVLLEHPPVFTVGSSGGLENLLVPFGDLKDRGIELYNTGRGGNITYHAPGQLVGYPIMDLKLHGRDLHLYVRSLEETMMRVLTDYGLHAHRIKGFPGVWIDNYKIASIGISAKRWVTMHGFALNVQPDLAPLALINPCGIKSDRYTSMQLQLGTTVDMDELKGKIINAWADVFTLTCKSFKLEQFEDILKEGVML